MLSEFRILTACTFGTIIVRLEQDYFRHGVTHCDAKPEDPNCPDQMCTQAHNASAYLNSTLKGKFVDISSLPEADATVDSIHVLVLLGLCMARE